MRRWPTWLLVGALGALGAVAAADALRGSSTRERAVPALQPVTRMSPVPAGKPDGVLYYSDVGDDCRLHGIGLPGLENAPPPKLRSCVFSLSPDGTAALPGRLAWSPRGGLFALASGGMIEVGSPASSQRLRFPGRVPSFMPDGTFTYVRGTKIVAWTTDCPPGTQLFTLPADNATARCRRVVARLGTGSVESLAWLTSRRLAAIVRSAEDALVIRTRSRVVTRILGARGALTDLRVSPRGTYVALQAEGRRGTLVVRRDGAVVPLPRLTHIRALAWSPDERWTAAATPRGVYVFRTNEGKATMSRLSLAAADLAWR
jgi:hypothetical protein